MSDSSEKRGNEEDGNSSKRIRIPESPKEQTVIPASPPLFVSLEELMTAAKGMTNMSLAHEIAVNKDFRLEKQEPPANSVERLVKETMHKVFWDILKSELEENPPKYSQALLLLDEVKSSLLNLLLPQHTRLKRQIDEVIDLDLIKQQTENGSLNFQEYAQFVLNVMGKMCAPVRDSRILELMKMTDVVPLFRGILETLELMRIDMANFTIDLMRPQIVANSVAYEKQKFADFIKLQPDGLKRTRNWLQKHLSHAGESSIDLKKRLEAVINHAYLDLAQWDQTELLPEVLTMDEARIKSCTEQLNFLIRVGTVLLLTYTHAGANLASIGEWKMSVKKTVLTLMSPKEATDVAALAGKLSSDIVSAAEKYNVSGHSASGLESLLSGAESKEHRVFLIMKSRILDFLLISITSRTAERLQIPPGLSVLQDELTQLTGNFLRMVSHNRAVFEEYYVDIVQELLKKSETASSIEKEPENPVATS